MRDVNPSSNAMNRLHWPLLSAIIAGVTRFWPLWTLVAAAVALRIYRLGDIPGLIGDEAWYGVQAQQLVAGSGGELRTPTGNVPGLFQLGSTILLHLVAQPSALLLRVPALVSSLAAMGLAYAVGRRFFGPVAGMGALVIMACLPANLAYARLGWDPSHAAMFILAAVYAALSRRRLLAVLLFGLALANHPAAVFVAPFLAFVYGGAVFGEAPRGAAVLTTALFASLLAVAIALTTLITPSASSYVSTMQIVGRISDPLQWLSFCSGVVRLLSGDTTSIFIAGRGLGPATTTVHLVIGLGLVGLTINGAIGLIRKPDRLVAACCVGWCASMLLLYLVGGSWALRPGLERFAMPVLPLTALVAGILVQRSMSRVAAQAVLVTVGLGGLTSFAVTILQPLGRGDARRAEAVWIGFPSLNAEALRVIDRDAPAGNVAVVAEDWWIYWPLAYRAPADRFTIIRSDSGMSPDIDAYWITYQGGEMDRALGGSGYDFSRTVTSADGSQALRIWRSPE